MIPDWLRSLRERLDADVPEWFIEHAPPSDPHRSSAVLVLFGPDADGETSIVLTERAHDLRSHAAQVVFPGGHVDPGETPIQAALRESTEEIGLDPHTVEIVCCLPGVYLTPASTEYVPVLGWWHTPHPHRRRRPRRSPTYRHPHHRRHHRRTQQIHRTSTRLFGPGIHGR